MPLKHLKCQCCDCIAVGFMTIYAYHNKCCEFESRSDKVYSIQHDVINCQRLAAGRWFSPGTQVSSTNKTDCHDTTEILLKVALNTITQTKSFVAMLVSTMILLLQMYLSDSGVILCYYHSLYITSDTIVNLLNVVSVW